MTFNTENGEDMLYAKDELFYYVNANDGMDQEWPFEYIYKYYKDNKDERL